MSEVDTPAASSGDGGLVAKLPTILWERRWWVIIPTVVLFLAGCVAALLLPTSYQSRAVVLVESQTLYGQPESNDEDNEIDRRIARIRQQLMSRPDLVELIQTNNLYDVSSNREPLSKLVDRLRDATNISAVDANISAGARGRAGQSSIAFALTFNYPRPDLAQLVAQTFTDRLLKLSATQSADEAQNSVRVLEDQAATVQQQLDGVEARIRTVTGQTGAALAAASSMGGGATNSGVYDTQISTLQRENAQLRGQLGSAALERDPAIVAAEARLAAALAQYSDSHPDVALARAQLAAARANASQLQVRSTQGTIQAQISVNSASIAQLQQARNAELGRASQLAAAQAQGPAAAATVSQLQSQAELYRGSLGKISSALLTARSTAKLTEEQRGERLTLIEPPVAPDTPTSPNRPLLIAGGLALGAMLGVALALLLELVLHPIRSVAAVKAVTGVAPLAVIPKLSARQQQPPKRWRFPFRRGPARQAI
jgi:succinoglycan biosynthesis transport protein ExoP